MQQTIGDNNMSDPSGKLSDEEKNQNLSITDEYFKMQEEEEIKSNVVPINNKIEQTQVSETLWEQALKIPDGEKRIEFIAKELDKAEVENGYSDADIDIDADWPNTDPPPIKYIIENFLPEKTVGILGAKGGVGKSMITLQLSIAVAGGYGGGEFFGQNIPVKSKVLFLSAEDTKEMCWRRLRNMRKSYDADQANFPVIDWEEVIRNLKIKSFVGENARLTTKDGNSPAQPVERTIKTIVNTANRIEGCKLIIVDTYSRFNGGSENSNEDAAMFISACEQIMKKTGCSVLVLAHMRKDQNNSGESEAIAGGGRFVDSARWAATMTPYIGEKAGDDLGMSEHERLRYIQFRVGKDNYSGKLGDSIYLYRNDSGILVKRNKPDLDGRTIKAKSKDDDRYDFVLPMIVSVVQEQFNKNAPLSVRRLRDHHSDRFGIGKNKVEQFCRKAISEKKIAEVPNRNGSGYLLEPA